MRIIIVFFEILWTRIRNHFGYTKDTSVIPSNTVYCYTFNGKNGVTKDGLPYLGTNMCPYYRGITKYKTACTFTGFLGEDLVHWDGCKICGQNIK